MIVSTDSTEIALLALQYGAITGKVGSIQVVKEGIYALYLPEVD